jgi:hypothetical protein
MRVEHGAGICAPDGAGPGKRISIEHRQDCLSIFLSGTKV